MITATANCTVRTRFPGLVEVSPRQTHRASCFPAHGEHRFPSLVAPQQDCQMPGDAQVGRRKVSYGGAHQLLQAYEATLPTTSSRNRCRLQARTTTSDPSCKNTRAFAIEYDRLLCLRLRARLSSRSLQHVDSCIRRMVPRTSRQAICLEGRLLRHNTSCLTSCELGYLPIPSSTGNPAYVTCPRVQAGRAIGSATDTRGRLRLSVGGSGHT